MREILFRGKRTDNSEWVYGYYVKMNVIGGVNHLIYSADSVVGVYKKPYIVDPETVGQYTGLTDKNGRKIFEGDILEFDDEIVEGYYTSCGREYNSWEVKNYGVVGFYEESAGYDFCKYKFNENQVEADLHENNTMEFADFVKELEIVGNIHDNPEMLEVEE